jgi:hypothetical protein
MAPVLTLKDAVATPAPTVTDEGVVSTAGELLMAITAPADPVWLRVTVQVLTLFGPRLPGVQDSEDTITEAVRLTLVFTELPP